MHTVDGTQQICIAPALFCSQRTAIEDSVDSVNQHWITAWLNVMLLLKRWELDARGRSGKYILTVQIPCQLITKTCLRTQNESRQEPKYLLLAGAPVAA